MGCCGGGAVSFLRIPGNIKQDFAPFQVVKGGGLQKFSFKPSRMSGCGKAGLINMVPSSISKNTQLFIDDISYKNQKQFKTFNDVLDTMPSITIREYLPDTKLDQSLNFFQDIFTNIFKGKGKKEFEDAGKNSDDATSKSDTLMQKLKRVVDAVMKEVDSKGWLDLVAPNDADGNPGAQQDQKYSSVIKFPFMMYYKLQSCMTSNIYELPCVPSNNAMYSSDGHPGWEGASGMRLLPDFAKNIPILGKMLDTLFGNMGINFTPWWDAAKGSETKAPELELKFSLFNDSIDAAVANFLFVNTIIAHCRWIQYGIMQHSSALYDVSLAGIGKQYACMGNFDVQYKGTLRTPSDSLLSQLSARVGSRYKPGAIVNKRQIKIPDVYDVTMKFQSLLPQNFNTFVFNFTQTDMMNMAANQASQFSNLTEGVKKIKKIAEDNW